jgi:signal recognition particle subunit SRP54
MLQMGKDERESMLEQGQVKMKRYEYAIQSMTIEERRKPDLISTTRIKRIAKGSGIKDADVSSMIKEFNQMRQVMKVMGPMMKPGGFNPGDLMNVAGKTNKFQKQEKKKEKGGPFGGGAFMKF